MIAHYDAGNPPALMRLVKQGVHLRAFPKDVMVAARKASFELYDAEVRRNPRFARIYREWKPFRDAQLQWFKVAEAAYSNFLFFTK